MLTLIAIVAAAVAVAVVANWKLLFFRWDLMDEIKKLTQDANTDPGATVAESTAAVVVEVTDTAAKVRTSLASVDIETKPRRARNSRGKFVGDDPATAPVNEAWVDGVAPAKKTAKRPLPRGATKKK